MDIKHIAFIMDGNRRYARKNKLQIIKGHGKGAKALEETVENCKKLGIKEITFYGLSEENIKRRPKIELNILFSICHKGIKNLTKKALENNTSIRFKGDLSLIPKKLRNLCEDCESKTKGNKKTIINLAIGYGGRQEIVVAINKILKKNKNKKITESLITENLYLSSEPDLIIRTGGEKRSSNFLTWQSIYSEWIFLNKTWPEFDLDDLKNCIKEFYNRKKNFGA